MFGKHYVFAVLVGLSLLSVSAIARSESTAPLAATEMATPGESLSIRSVPNLRDLGGYKTSAILGVKQEYLDAAFDEMETKYGTIEKYFSGGLGIDAAGQEALRDLYLAQK